MEGGESELGAWKRLEDTVKVQRRGARDVGNLNC